MPYTLHHAAASIQGSELAGKKRATGNAWEIHPRTVRADAMMSGPAQVIFPAAIRSWISKFELGNVVSDAFMVIALP
jgi:hypothetical protein